MSTLRCKTNQSPEARQRSIYDSNTKLLKKIELWAGKCHVLPEGPDFDEAIEVLFGLCQQYASQYSLKEVDKWPESTDRWEYTIKPTNGIGIFYMFGIDELRKKRIGRVKNLYSLLKIYYQRYYESLSDPNKDIERKHILKRCDEIYLKLDRYEAKEA